MAEDVTWSPVPNAESAMATSPLEPDADSLDEYDLVVLSDLDIPPELPSCTGDSLQVNVQGSLTSTASWSGPLPASRHASSDGGSYNSRSDTSETSESSDNESDVPLHYSRRYRMTEDYLDGNPLESELIPYPTEDASKPLEFPGDADVQSSIAAVHGALHERLDVDKDTIMCLAEIAALNKPMTLDIQTGKEYSVRRQQIELPILREDHDMQLRNARARNKLQLTSRNFEPFVLHEEADEGPGFPQRTQAEVQALDKTITDEKWSVSQETMEYLRYLMKMLNEAPPEVEYKPRLGTVTPPLLPLSPPVTPGIPEGDAMQIDFTSTPEDLIAQDAVAAAEAVLAEDAAFVNTIEKFGTREGASEMSDYILPKSIDAAPSSSSPLGKKRLRNLKLDSPLLPITSGESPAKKAKKVSFPAELASLIPDPAPDSSAQDSERVQADIDNFVQSVIKPFADSVMLEVSSEKLSEVDTTMRIRVPEIDAVQFRAPWAKYISSSETVKPLEAQRALLQYTKRELLRDEQKWSGVSKLERVLPWKPFPPHLGKINAAEDFDDGSLDRYMSELNLEAEVDPLQLVAQPGVLQISQDREDDDEELKPFLTSMKSSTASGTAPRPVNDGPARNPIIPGQMPTTLGQPSMPGSSGHKSRDTGSIHLINTRHDQVARAPRTIVPFDNTAETERSVATSTSILREDGLSSFMRLQGKSSACAKPTAITAAIAKKSAPPVAVMLPPAQPAPRVQFAVPAANLHYDRAISIVVSPTLMANRNQIRALQTALPKLELIERAPLSSALGNGKFVFVEECDITLSPSTGLLFTTLQKLKQRPLPGQSDFRGVRERITAVAAHFERLLVFVSEANNSETGAEDLDDRDAEALSDVIAFTSSIDCEVKVTYVPGGDTDLTGRTAAAIASYSVADGSITLLQDETLWERFLRKAGLNAFAAQAILGQLKRTNSTSSEATMEERSGLGAFVCMSVEERVQRFGALLGGDRLLRRVSQVIDAKW
ncbi:hypothetical protein B0A48_04901 [Cryoendolithus antarcticus]|uniref:Uncharacterized protein n=1 Tax=Cryoendolithus antarcticus TaxID=1507870 RepID=A0A1V8TDP5_9PEZI|nr:hypothetical protein B0A48_04901 [Cryoendolithus antarcticus]